MANSVVSASDLAALETLLNEFYASQTSNTRKREIEQVCTKFGYSFRIGNQINFEFFIKIIGSSFKIGNRRAEDLFLFSLQFYQNGASKFKAKSFQKLSKIEKIHLKSNFTKYYYIK